MVQLLHALVVMLSMLMQVNAVYNGVARVWIKLLKEGLIDVFGL